MFLKTQFDTLPLFLFIAIMNLYIFKNVNENLLLLFREHQLSTFSFNDTWFSVGHLCLHSVEVKNKDFLNCNLELVKQVFPLFPLHPVYFTQRQFNNRK